MKINLLLVLCLVAFVATEDGDDKWDSLTSPYAPEDSQRTFRKLPRVSDDRLKKIRGEFMYWYWDQGGSTDNIGDLQTDIKSLNPILHKNLDFELPFFGFRFNYTRVSLNGYLAFSDPPPVETYPLVFPNKDWPEQNDPSFIGIFHSKCRIGSKRESDIDQRTPGVYFRVEPELQSRTDVFGTEMRDRLTSDIRDGTVGADNFHPKHAIITTWKNVTFSGGISQSRYITNTFQMVLATDEVVTYAIFNYEDLQWTTHTEANGDTLKGEGGIPAFVGFNGGNGTRSYEYRPYSQAPDIRELTTTGRGNGFPGRHIFKIDDEVITVYKPIFLED